MKTLLLTLGLLGGLDFQVSVADLRVLRDTVTLAHSLRRSRRGRAPAAEVTGRPTPKPLKTFAAEHDAWLLARCLATPRPLVG